MSYSLFHYFEDSINKFLYQYASGCVMPRLPKKYSMDFTEDYSKVVSFAYLIYNAKKQNEDFDNTVGSLIELVNNLDIKQYISKNLFVYENGSTEFFQDVADEHLQEVTDYITKIYDTKTFYGVDKGGLQTPDTIMNLAYRILDINKKDQVANFCSSTGVFLSMCEDSLKSGKQLVGYELDEDKYVISLMIKDIKKKNYDLKHCDVLETKISGYTKIFADLPFKLDMKLDSDNLKNLAEEFGEQNAYSVLGEKLFIQKIIDSLTDDGKALVIVPTFFITSGNCISFRNYLLTNGYLNCVIQCGFGLIPGTGISVTLLVISKNNERVRFIDASDESTKERLLSVFSDENIEHIVRSYNAEINLQESEDFKEHGVCPYRIVSFPSEFIEKTIDLKGTGYDLLPYSYVSNISTNQEGCSPLGKLCTVKRGASFSSNELIHYTSREIKEGNDEEEKDTFLYLSQKDMQDGEILYDNLETLIIPRNKNNFKKNKDGKDGETKYQILQDEDIVFCCLKTSPLKIAMVHRNDNEIKIIPSCNIYVIRIRDEYKGKISPYFIQACLDKASTYRFIEANTNTFKILQKTVQRVQIPTDLSDEKVEDIAENYKALQDKIANLQKELANCRDELKDIVESI